MQKRVSRLKCCFLSSLVALLLTSSLFPYTASAAEKKDFTLIEASIEDIQKALLKGSITSEELVEMYLKRIEKYDDQGPKINSLVYVNPHALEEARKLDEERKRKGPRGPLHGIPIILKDNIDTYDMPTTGSAKALEGSIPPDDAFITKKLREAGAIIIAKSNLHELARAGTTVSSLGGQTLNPYDLTRTPGGSSGGTGAAIASNFAVAGVGTDTVNSVRSPSSANNLVGIRPTRGLISRDGIIPAALTQDTAGPMARTVRDAAIMLDAMAGYDPNDPETAWSIGHIPETYTAFLNKKDLKGVRLGVLKTLFGKDAIHEEVNKVMQIAIKDLEKLGAEIVYIDVPELDTERISKEIDVQVYESKPQINQYLKSLGKNAPIKTVKELIETNTVHPTIAEGLKATEALTNSLEMPEYKERLVKREELRTTIANTMAKYGLDALVYPHQKQLVAKIGDPQLERNGMLASASGFPAITVPAGFSTPTETAPLGVPVGIEFLGMPWTEPQLLSIAYAYEQFTNHRTPPLSTP